MAKKSTINLGKGFKVENGFKKKIKGELQVDLWGDPWKIKGTDSKGHGSKFSYSVPNKFIHWIDKIVHDPKSPFHSRSEFGRWSLNFSLKVLSVMGLEWTPTVTFDGILLLLQEQYYNEEMMIVLKKANEQIVSLVAEGEKGMGEARRIILSVKREVDSIENDYWREKLQKEVKDRWEHLLLNMPKVNLKKVG